MPELPFEAPAPNYGNHPDSRKQADTRGADPASMPKAIFNEDDEITLRQLARIGRSAVPLRRRHTRGRRP